MLKLQVNETLESIIGKQVMYGNVVGVMKTSIAIKRRIFYCFFTQETSHWYLCFTVWWWKSERWQWGGTSRKLLEKDIGSKEVEFKVLKSIWESLSFRACLASIARYYHRSSHSSPFGIYSMVSLTCQQGRKEIAIRKVFGATVAWGYFSGICPTAWHYCRTHRLSGGNLSDALVAGASMCDKPPSTDGSIWLFWYGWHWSYLLRSDRVSGAYFRQSSGSGEERVKTKYNNLWKNCLFAISVYLCGYLNT